MKTWKCSLASPMHRQVCHHFRNFSKNLRNTNSELRRFRRFRKLSQMSQCLINLCMAFLAPEPITRCQCCISIATTVLLTSARLQVQLNYPLSAWIRLTGRSLTKEEWHRQMQHWSRDSKAEENSCRTLKSLSNEMMEVGGPIWKGQRQNHRDQSHLSRSKLRLSLKSKTSLSRRTFRYIRRTKMNMFSLPLRQKEITILASKLMHFKQNSLSDLHQMKKDPRLPMKTV